MSWTELAVPGTFLIHADVLSDARGHYSPLWRGADFGRAECDRGFVQLSRSFSERRGTLRGLHWQVAPHREAKLVFCTRGRVYDVIVDTRPESPSLGRWAGCMLGAADHRLIYVPPGCAHGILTLEDDCEIVYTSTGEYHPESERGLRFDDRAIRIEWPDEVRVISDKDAAWPDFDVPVPVELGRARAGEAAG